jgi:uncharacterized protein YkwD
LINRKITLHIGLVLVLSLCCSSIFAQQYPFDKWDQSTLEKANTAKDVSYMTHDEKQVIFYMNLARINPKLFAETYLQEYRDSVKEDGTLTSSMSSSITSLQKELRSIGSTQALHPLKELYGSASDHAKKTGRTGEVGHDDYEQRFAAITKKYNSYATGENCDYGTRDPLAIVLGLLIDDGVANLGHRKNILNTNFTYVGVSIAPHKKYEWDCVIDLLGE